MESLLNELDEIIKDVSRAGEFLAQLPTIHCALPRHRAVKILTLARERLTRFTVFLTDIGYLNKKNYEKLLKSRRISLTLDETSEIENNKIKKNE